MTAATRSARLCCGRQFQFEDDTELATWSVSKGVVNGMAPLEFWPTKEDLRFGWCMVDDSGGRNFMQTIIMRGDLQEERP